MSERRNGTRRLYRARPEGLVPCEAVPRGVLGPPVGGAQARDRTRGEEEAWKRQAETPAVEREIAIAARPKRSGSSSSTRTRPRAGWARAPLRAAARRPVPRRGNPRQQRGRRVRRARRAAPARVHVGLGARRHAAPCRSDQRPSRSSSSPPTRGRRLRFTHRGCPPTEAAPPTPTVGITTSSGS